MEPPSETLIPNKCYLCLFTTYLKKKKGLTIFFVFINIPYRRYTLCSGKETNFLPRRRKGWDITEGEQNENSCRPGDRALRDAGHRHYFSPDFQTEKRTKAPEGSEESFSEVISNNSSLRIRPMNIPLANQKVRKFIWPFVSPLLKIQGAFSRSFPLTFP